MVYPQHAPTSVKCVDKAAKTVHKMKLVLRKVVKSDIIKDMPKRTHQPHKRHRAKTHGFRARVSTKAGRNVLKLRRIKGRAKIAL